MLNNPSQTLDDLRSLLDRMVDLSQDPIWATLADHDQGMLLVIANTMCARAQELARLTHRLDSHLVRGGERPEDWKTST